VTDDEVIRRAYAIGYRDGWRDTLTGDLDHDLINTINLPEGDHP
jgi:hypothetical protein